LLTLGVEHIQAHRLPTEARLQLLLLIEELNALVLDQL
jgi:hypothetical protein